MLVYPRRPVTPAHAMLLLVAGHSLDDAENVSRAPWASLL